MSPNNFFQPDRILRARPPVADGDVNVIVGPIVTKITTNAIEVVLATDAPGQITLHVCLPPIERQRHGQKFAAPNPTSSLLA